MAYRIEGTDPPVSFTPIKGLTAPTRQDTADVVARSEAVRLAMENARDARGKRMYEADETRSRKKSMPKEAAFAKLQNARNSIADREGRNFVTILDSEQGRTKGILPFGDYARQVSPEKFEQREIEAQIVNPTTPMSLYDARIQPDTVYLYRQRTKDGLTPDLVSVPGYSKRMLPLEAGGTPTPAIVQPVQRPMQRVPRQENVSRVSFGTRGNRPLYSPGPAGRRGGGNRLQGQGALMNAWERVRDIFD
jgi:hypothetical protein